MNQTEQTSVNNAWEQNIVFQEVQKPEIYKWRDLSPGDYKVLDVEDRGTNKYGLKVVLCVEKLGEGEKVYVWAPTSLICAIKHRNGTYYIRHRGAKQSPKGNMYFDFGFA